MLLLFVFACVAFSAESLEETPRFLCAPDSEDTTHSAMLQHASVLARFDAASPSSVPPAHPRREEVLGLSSTQLQRSPAQVSPSSTDLFASNASAALFGAEMVDAKLSNASETQRSVLEPGTSSDVWGFVNTNVTSEENTSIDDFNQTEGGRAFHEEVGSTDEEEVANNSLNDSLNATSGIDTESDGERARRRQRNMMMCGASVVVPVLCLLCADIGTHREEYESNRPDDDSDDYWGNQKNVGVA